MLFLVLLCLAPVTFRDCRALDCVAQIGPASITPCADVSQAQLVQQLPSSDAQELNIESARITRQPSSLTVYLNLRGSFWNESDQNLYVFIGQSRPLGAPVSYSLSSDEQYFADLSYDVRNSIELPHSNDIRVGIMAPREAAYTPQVYINDAVHTDLAGREAHISMALDQHLVRLELPLLEYYRRKGASLPDRISVTLATARDYVGFIDQISVMDIGAGETKDEDRKPLPAMRYPMLRYDSHLFKSVMLAQDAGSLKVELEMQSEIEDWAQTNLYFFFVPAPPVAAKPAPQDPSKSIKLPYPWSFYCGVYSPQRLFCKESGGVDFTYDEGYAERSALELPEGVRFRVLGNAKYSLEFTPRNVEKIRAGRDRFALLLMAGRDGFGPTSCYGWNRASRCRLMQRLANFISPD
jgi:hypothetical protein